METVTIEQGQFERFMEVLWSIHQRVTDIQETMHTPVIVNDVKCTNKNCPWNLKNICGLIRVCPGRKE